MPYIAQQVRVEIDPYLDDLIVNLDNQPGKDGAVSYAITRIIDKLYRGRYSTLSQGVGVLECTKQEFLRRRLNPYEDSKKEAYGDAYD